MANVYTTFATEQLAALSDGSERPTLPLNGGNVHTIQVTKTSLTAATADPVYLVRLPKGARVLASNCSVDFGSVGASGTLTGKVGYIYDDASGSSDAYASGLTLAYSANPSVKQLHGNVGTGGLTPVTFTAPAWVYVTWTSLPTSPAAHTQVWTISYTLA
jgi:hypothetical protein